MKTISVTFSAGMGWNDGSVCVLWGPGSGYCHSWHRDSVTPPPAPGHTFTTSFVTNKNYSFPVSFHCLCCHRFQSLIDCGRVDKMTKVRVLNCDTEGRSRIMHQLGCNTNTFSWDANICLHLGLLMTRGVTKRNLFLCGDGEVQRAELSVPIKQRVCLFCLRNLATRENKTQLNKMLPQELMNATSSQTTWQLRDAWRDLLFIVTKIFIEMFATAAAVSPRATGL